jgi:non-heme chloroperoxidase
MGGLKGQLDSIRAFSESDFHADLAKVDVPTLVLHGDDDQIVPIGAAALSTVKIVTDAVLIVYEGADHGLTQTHQDRFNADLLDFING